MRDCPYILAFSNSIVLISLKSQFLEPLKYIMDLSHFIIPDWTEIKERGLNLIKNYLGEGGWGEGEDVCQIPQGIPATTTSSGNHWQMH